MAVTDDAAGSGAGARRSAPDPEARTRGATRPRRFTVGGVFRLLVFVALAAFLLYYVGPRDIAETALKVVLAVVLTAALWVGANLLFDQAYDHWTRFNTIIGVGGRLRRLLRRRGQRLVPHALRQARCGSPARDCSTTSPAGGRGPLDVNGLLWGLIGGAALGLVMFLLSVPRQQVGPAPAGRARVRRLRVPHGVRLRRLGVAGDRLDASCGSASRAGAALFGLIGLWRYGAARAPLSVLTGAVVGWLVGAWGGGDVGGGNFLGVAYATVVPAAILGVRFGLAAEPDAQKRRRIDQRSRAWIFVTPALALHRCRAARAR